MEKPVKNFRSKVCRDLPKSLELLANRVFRAILLTIELFGACLLENASKIRRKEMAPEVGLELKNSIQYEENSVFARGFQNNFGELGTIFSHLVARSLTVSLTPRLLLLKTVRRDQASSPRHRAFAVCRSARACR
ncbi:MAG: hypothetical protein JWM68_622 [Verrucomicrobiales bacterium]|nr:hypothetical protein [Verrucomicrobiales bacterium]